MLKMKASKVFFWFAVFFVLVFASYNALHEAEFDFIWGMRDHTSDRNTFIAAENFKKYGFTELGLRVYHTPIHSHDMISEVRSYKGYPPLSDWINGFMMKIGIDSMRGIRLIYALISLFGLFSIFLFVSKVFGKNYGLFSMFFVGTSEGFVIFSASAYAHPFTFVFPYLVMLASVSFVETRKEKFLFFTFILSFLNALSSYDMVPYPFVFSTLYAFYETREKSTVLKVALAIFLGSSTAFLLWFLINSSEMGVNYALHDLLNRLSERMVGVDELAKESILFHLGKMVYFTEEFFGWGTSLIAIWFTIRYVINKIARLRNRKEESSISYDEKLCDRTAIVLLSSLSWAFFMPQHFVIHLYFVVPRHFAVFMSLVIIHFLRWAVSKPMFISVPLIAFVVLSQIDRTFDTLSIKRTEFISPELKEKLEVLEKVNSPVIYHNLSAYPHIVISYYIRNIKGVEMESILTEEHISSLADISRRTCVFLLVQKYYPRFSFENYRDGELAPLSSFMRQILERKIGRYKKQPVNSKGQEIRVKPQKLIEVAVQNSFEKLYEDERFLLFMSPSCKVNK